MTVPRSVKLNAEWHRAHRMPPNATFEQRVEWHKEHSARCSCRPMPASVRAAIVGATNHLDKRNRTG